MFVWVHGFWDIPIDIIGWMIFYMISLKVDGSPNGKVSAQAFIQR